MTIFVCWCTWKNCPNFMWQIHLLKNWRASFYVARKKCHMRKFVRVCEPSQKICHILSGWQWLLRVWLHHPQSFLAHRQTSFQHSICCLYTRANIFVAGNLPQKICSCGLGFNCSTNNWISYALNVMTKLLRITILIDSIADCKLGVALMSWSRSFHEGTEMIPRL